MKKILTLVITLLLTLTLTACNDVEQYDVYVTVYPMQYLTETIAGDTVTVGRVPGSTVHSESYDWSSKEIITMKEATYIFYVGAHLDEYIPDNEEDIFGSGTVELVHIGDYVTYEKACYESDHHHEESDTEAVTESNDEHEHDHEECDSSQLVDDAHFWLDPANMIIAAEMVKDKLIEAYPENEALYNDNYTTLIADLTTLDAAYNLMSTEAVKPIITTNMLFNYWHHAYDLTIMSLIADAHVSNTVPDDIIHFVDEAIYHDIHFILFEKYSNSPTGTAVLTELQLQDDTAEARYLHGLSTLTSDEMEAGENYLTIMYDNLAVLNEVTK